MSTVDSKQNSVLFSTTVFRALLLVSSLSELDLSGFFTAVCNSIPPNQSFIRVSSASRRELVSLFVLYRVTYVQYPNEHICETHRGWCKDETNWHHSLVIRALYKNDEIIVVFFWLICGCERTVNNRCMWSLMPGSISLLSNEKDIYMSYSFYIHEKHDFSRCHASSVPSLQHHEYTSAIRTESLFFFFT